ncbi:MAG TPA: hypothetical protein VN703_09740 [Candidatus Sulfopaludibacter sp.]|jgi:hypothetical protein|nr:hypothetical protein [Candidatus Sulfopaludibacter sp.]
MQRNRPLGVTIIAILAVLGGIGSFLSGLTVLAIIPILGIIFGGILIIIGLAYFAVAYGLWKGLRWAWILTLIVSVIGIIVGLGSIVVGNAGSLFHVIVNAIVIYYLYRPNVKAYFGK